jgi:hypothetical protein
MLYLYSTTIGIKDELLYRYRWWITLNKFHILYADLVTLAERRINDALYCCIMMMSEMMHRIYCICCRVGSCRVDGGVDWIMVSIMMTMMGPVVQRLGLVESIQYRRCGL